MWPIRLFWLMFSLTEFMLLFNKKDTASKKETQQATRQRSFIIQEEQDIHQLLNEIKDKVDRFDEWIVEQKKKESALEK